MSFEVIISSILAVALALFVPILIAGVGEIISERAGILNIGIEGYMIIGTIASYLTAYVTGSIWLAVLMGMVAAIMTSLIHGYLSINLGSSQLLSGIGINILAAGLAVILYRETIFKYVAITPEVEMFKKIYIPFLSDLPLIGPILFQNILVYIGILLSILLWLFLFKTYFGLTLRATGEDPLTVDTSGLNPIFIRYIGLIIGSALAGLGGAYLVLGHVGRFSPGMTAGRGFVALAIAIAANWNPLTCLLISFLFGIVEATQLRVQVIGYAHIFPFLMAIPYIFTIIVLVARRRVLMPMALATPYVRKRK